MVTYKDLLENPGSVKVNAYVKIPSEAKFVALLRAFAGENGESLQLTYSEREAARVLFGPGASPSGIRLLRNRGEGPTFILINGRIRYRLFDLLDWLDHRITYRNSNEAYADGYPK